MKDDYSRLDLIELRLGRIESDIESEKGTRLRSNNHIDGRFDKIEDMQRRSDRIVYGLLGLLSAVELVLRIVKK